MSDLEPPIDVRWVEPQVEILRLRAENEKLRKEKAHANYCCDDLRITFHNEVEKLRAALKPFKEIHDNIVAAFPDAQDDDEVHFGKADFAHLRAAAAALKGTGE